MLCEEARELVPAYVLGALEEADHSLVQAHLAICPQCAEDVRQGADTLARLADLLPQEAPSPVLKTRLFSSLRIPEPLEVGRRRAVVLRTRRWWFAGAAAVLALGIAGLLVAQLTLFSRMSDLEERTALLTSVEEGLGDQSQMLASLEDEQENLVSMVRQQRSLTYWLSVPGSQVAVIEPAPAARGYGLLLIPPKSSVAVLVAAGLSAPPEGQSYQVWLVRGTERISGGMFKPDATGWAQMAISVKTPVEEFEQLGVTIEPAGGSSAPSTPSILQAVLRKPR